MDRSLKPKPGKHPCPHCGEPIPLNAKFCRSCGASEDQGWRAEDSWNDESSGGYGADDFDYEEFIAQEFPQNEIAKPKRLIWWYVAWLMLFVFIMLIVVEAIAISTKPIIKE